MTPNISVKEVFSDLNALGKAMNALTFQDVFVGMPEDETSREKAEDAGISNAYLAYIHEHGVPENNLPARPALNPGIQSILPEAIELLEQAAKKAMDGDEDAVHRNLKKIGLLGERAVKAKFKDNNWQELKEETLNRQPKIGETVDKEGKKVVSYGKSRAEKGRINPLIDSMQLLKSYTYVIRERTNSKSIITS